MKSLQTLDLNLLKAFSVLMDERNVSKAAEHAVGHERRVGKIAW